MLPWGQWLTAIESMHPVMWVFLALVVLAFVFSIVRRLIRLAISLAALTILVIVIFKLTSAP